MDGPRFTYHPVTRDQVGHWVFSDSVAGSLDPAWIIHVTGNHLVRNQGAKGDP